MNTQNAPLHIRLWHRNFWLMVVANLLLSTSVTMLIPTLPQRMLYVDGLTAYETGLAMGIFAVGLFLLGGLCSFLVQHYRRNQVCVWATVVLALTFIVPCYWQVMPLWAMLLLRLVQGASFGLAQMVLSSTLIIDTCESFQRTEANHSATWFSRFALSLGPMAGLLLSQLWSFDIVLLSAIGCLAVTIVLILMVHFPFRVPEDHLHLWSLDRFFLTRGWLLFFNLLLVSTGIGLVFSLLLDVQFYGLMMVGFLLALLAETFVFRDADLKSEVVSGLLLIVASLLILNFSPSSPLHSSLLGLGAGLVGARFLLFFIKLSRHCQRGTSQSTFLLGWESGLALGIGIGYSVFEMQKDSVLLCALLLVLLALAIYVTFVHGWFLKHRNR
jgi:MFS family permease